MRHSTRKRIKITHKHRAPQPKTKPQHTNRTIHNHHTNTNQNHFQRRTPQKSEQTLYISFILSIPTKNSHNKHNILYATIPHTPTPQRTKLYIISSYASVAGGKSKGGKLWHFVVAVVAFMDADPVLIKHFTRASVVAYLIAHRLIDAEVSYDE